MKRFTLILIFILLVNLSFITAVEENNVSVGVIDFDINDIPDSEIRSGQEEILKIELYELNNNSEIIPESKIFLDYPIITNEIKTGDYILKVFSEDKIFTRKITVTNEIVMNVMYTNTQQKDIEADIPWGVNKDSFPLYLLVHDADLNGYDVYDIKTYDDNQLIQDESDDILVDTLDLKGNSCWGNDYETIDDKLWYKIRNLDVSDFNVDSEGFIHIRVFYDQAGLCDALDWDTEVFKKIKVMDKSIPKINGYYCGDTHYHSSYTDTWWGISEFVGYGEIGGSIEMAVKSLDTIGLDWVTVTDHSNSFGENAGFWNAFYNECNSYSKCLIGEEVNSDPEVFGNVPTCESLPGNHLLAYRISQGLTDSACNNVKNVSERLTDIRNLGGFTYIAHPESQDDAVLGWDSVITNFRGYSLTTYTGLEIWNQDIKTQSSSVEALNKGLEKWKDVLLGRNGLTPRKVFISAGSDAHGDFQEFAKEYTCVYAPAYTKQNIFNGLEKGNSFISNNGALIFKINNSIIGNEINISYNSQISLDITYNVTDGCYISVFRGVIGDSEETKIGEDYLISSNRQGSLIRYDTPPANSYYRAECISSDKKSRIYTNPIWTNVINAPIAQKIDFNARIKIEPSATCAKYGYWIESLGELPSGMLYVPNYPVGSQDIKIKDLDNKEIELKTSQNCTSCGMIPTCNVYAGFSEVLYNGQSISQGSCLITSAETSICYKNASSIRILRNQDEPLINCSQNSDCGTDSINKYCNGNNACETTINYTCHNAGTEQSYCTSSSGGGCNSCPFGCNESGFECKIQPPQSNELIINSPSSNIYNERSLMFNLSSQDKFIKLIYTDNGGRESSLCTNCNKYTQKKSLSDGNHVLLFRGILPNGKNVTNQTKLFVDSKDPQISTTKPANRKYTNGSDFYIKYTEDNCQTLKILINGQEILSNQCQSGKNIEKTIPLDVSSFNGQEVEYKFMIIDIANNTDESRATKIKVDTTAPEIKGFKAPISGRYVSFNMTILNEDKNSFDTVEYKDNSETRWNSLCPSLKNNNCFKKVYFRTGNHNIIVRATDDAGNSDTEIININII